MSRFSFVIYIISYFIIISKMFNQEVVFYVLIGRVVCLSTETNKVTKGGLGRKINFSVIG